VLRNPEHIAKKLISLIFRMRTMGEKRSVMPTDNPISVLHHVLEALAQGDWSIFDTHLLSDN
jgi:hypothetical protein